MSAKAWCYNCEKTIEPTPEGNCPICQTDFIEYASNEFDPEMPAPAPEPPQQPRVRAFTFTFPGGGLFGNMFPNLFGQQNPTNQNGQQQGNILGDLFNNIARNIFGALGGNPNEGSSLGDFFMGSEAQLQELAERLFRLNESHLGSPPVPQSYIDSLQTTPYSAEVCCEDTCSICLEQFKDQEDIIILPCKHGFHKDCVHPWLQMHSECPSCRYKLPSEE